MPYIEPKLIQTEKQAADFRELCHVVFANEHGRKLLGRLVSACNPMRARSDFTAELSDTHKTAFVDGQCDIIQLLWRYGSDVKALPEPRTDHE